MVKARRLIPVVAALLTVVMIAAAPAEAKKKKQKKAAPTIRAEATFLAPGGIVQAQLGENPITALFLEFDLLKTQDNAKAEATVSISVPGDIACEIEIADSAGEFQDFPTSAAAGDPGSCDVVDASGEDLGQWGRLGPGHYRIIMFLRAGAPATMGTLELVFFNTAGKPGPG